MTLTNSKFHKDTSINHIHEDPKLIIQVNVRNELKIGQVVYQNDAGKYVPAISTSDFKKGNIQGIVWGFIGVDQFYLRTAPGPMTYRHPLTVEFFSSIGENDYVSNLPGSHGDILWLSETNPGYTQHELPAEGNAKIIVGYKTEYGFLYQPKFIICCNGSSSSSSSIQNNSSSSSEFDVSSSSSSIRIPPPPQSSSSSVDISGSSSSSVDISGSSSSSVPTQLSYCWYVYEAVYDCGWTIDPTNTYTVCLSDEFQEFLTWVSLGGCRALKLIKGPVCVVNEDCTLPTLAIDDLPNWTPPDCCSSSSSSVNYVCWYIFESEYICGSGWNTPSIRSTICDTNEAYTEHDWTVDPLYPCFADKIVKGVGSCTSILTDCLTPPSVSGPALSEPANCCNSSSSSSGPSKYWKYTCVATPECVNGNLGWSVSSYLNGPYNSSLSDTNWANITDECGDQRSYWEGPYNDVSEVPSANCAEPYTPPGSACLPCSSSSSVFNACPTISPPIGYVAVTAAGFDWDSRLNGTFAVPINGGFGSYTIFEDIGSGTYRGTVSVSINCNSSDLAPCPSDYPNSVCGCFSGTLPAGWYYAISVGDSYYNFGGGNYSHFAVFAQPLNGGGSMQSYVGFSNFNTDSRYCDSNYSASVL